MAIAREKLSNWKVQDPIMHHKFRQLQNRALSLIHRVVLDRSQKWSILKSMPHSLQNPRLLWDIYWTTRKIDRRNIFPLLHHLNLFRQPLNIQAHMINTLISQFYIKAVHVKVFWSISWRLWPTVWKCRVNKFLVKEPLLHLLIKQIILLFLLVITFITLNSKIWFYKILT